MTSEDNNACEDCERTDVNLHDGIEMVYDETMDLCDLCLASSWGLVKQDQFDYK